MTVKSDHMAWTNGPVALPKKDFFFSYHPFFYDMGISEVFDPTSLIPGWHPLNPHKCILGKSRVVLKFEHKMLGASPSLMLLQLPGGYVGRIDT